MTTNAVSTAIVTGGSKGFGRAVAADLARHGWYVVIDGRDVGLVRGAARDLGVIGVAGDVTRAAHRAQLVATVAEAGGRLDLLVNNAGALGPSPLPAVGEFPLEALRSLYEANVVAPLALVQLALPLLRRSEGAVVNVTSDAAVEAYAGWGGYGSSKAALEALTRTMAVEEPGIRVWALDPGDMRTEMHQAAFPGEDISDRPLPELVSPAVLALVGLRPPSGRLKASELLAAGNPAAAALVT